MVGAVFRLGDGQGLEHLVFLADGEFVPGRSDDHRDVLGQFHGFRSARLVGKDDAVHGRFGPEEHAEKHVGRCGSVFLGFATDLVDGLLAGCKQLGIRDFGQFIDL